jgi:hypothetical protein
LVGLLVYLCLLEDYFHDFFHLLFCYKKQPRTGNYKLKRSKVIPLDGSEETPIVVADASPNAPMVFLFPSLFLLI